MKINSINYGGKVICIGLIIMLLVPSILMWLNTFLEHKVIIIFAIISFVVGICILIGFIAVLFIEFRQDKKIDNYYSSHKNIKIKTGNNSYECAMCGNRLVYINSTYCAVCGCNFGNEEDKKPQEIIKIQ